jgi:hypothetical protein
MEPFFKQWKIEAIPWSASFQLLVFLPVGSSRSTSNTLYDEVRLNQSPTFH